MVCRGVCGSAEGSADLQRSLWFVEGSVGLRRGLWSAEGSVSLWRGLWSAERSAGLQVCGEVLGSAEGAVNLGKDLLGLSWLFPC